MKCVSVSVRCYNSVEEGRSTQKRLESISLTDGQLVFWPARVTIHGLLGRVIEKKIVESVNKQKRKKKKGIAAAAVVSNRVESKSCCSFAVV